MNTILISIIVFSNLGLFFGIILGFASKYFQVKDDILTEKINEILSQSQYGKYSYLNRHPYIKEINSEAQVKYYMLNEEDVIARVTSFMHIHPKINNNEGSQSTNFLRAIINESNCIGCTKCARVCPVNAIIGARHTIHTVISEFCTGCNLCVTSCPTQCVSLESLHINISNIWKWNLQAIPVRIIYN